ncbi:MAG: S8 family serine peptidase, partial [Lachnospiraceae bacterium]|nr:S8 family serine peptidase [Lachnospiraceae bacterium]
MIIAIYSAFFIFFSSTIYEMDELSSKQWYIQEKYKGLIQNDENCGEENFIKNSSVEISSVYDIGIVRAWKRNQKGKKVIIALIDTTVDIYHEDLYENIWVNNNEIPFDNIDNDGNGYIDDYNGWNFVINNGYVNSDADINEHGTHCAGIIAAGHNKVGVMGIAGNSNVKLMVLPALLSKRTENDINNVISAIKYAENNGADICNLSFSFSEYSKELDDVIRNSNMLFVVASGNYSSDLGGGIDLEKVEQYPASFNYKNVITVANLSDDMKIAYNSNYGKNTVDIGAPGEFIYSTLPKNRYGFMSGSSQAAPIVSGILAMIYSYYKDDTIYDSVDRLYNNS